MIHLLPTPTTLRLHPGTFAIPSPPTASVPDHLDHRVSKLLLEIFPTLHHFAARQPNPAIRIQTTPGPAESYALSITSAGIRIDAPDAPGAFYALQTLRQILAQSGPSLPCLEIADAPSFPLRGYYLDVSRGRVPRIETLRRRIRLLASLKINHLQLYFEHPFRFAFDPSIPGPPHSDAFSPDDLRSLDAFCREHFVELVPSFTCFGHLGRILSLPQYRDLAEAEFPAPSWEAATWLQQLRGATIHSRDPGAQDLLRAILDEFLPCFSSSRFNLCGDETHDLGKRTPGATPSDLARQYADHVRFVHSLAARHGKSIMLWGDVLLHRPEAIDLLPPRCEILDWAYFPSNDFDKCSAFADRSVPFAVCPSVRGFGSVFNAVEEARAVLAKYARAGQRRGAFGLLNTDWGDYGHFNMPPCALHGLALGAQLAWNPGNDESQSFDAAFSKIMFASGDSLPAQLFSLAGSAHPSLAAWPFPPLKNVPPPDDPAAAPALAENAPRWADAFSRLSATEWVDETEIAELSLACRFLQFNALLAAGAPASQTLPLLDALEKAYAPLWFAESQPRGLLEIHSRAFQPMRKILLGASP